MSSLVLRSHYVEQLRLIKVTAALLKMCSIMGFSAVLPKRKHFHLIIVKPKPTYERNVTCNFGTAILLCSEGF